MVQIILTEDIEQEKVDTILLFLESLDIKAEINTKKKVELSLSKGIWKDYDIDANNLRKRAWNLNK